MSFHSFDFLFFLLGVVSLYFILPQSIRWFWLLLTSYVFYASFEPVYLVLIGATTMVTYSAGLLMSPKKDMATGKSRRGIILTLALLLNFGLLVYFKYFDFLINQLSFLSITSSLQSDVLFRSVILPVGISFYTFQLVSYLIDVYLEEKKPEKHLGYFALYVVFFPQLIAGPIERAKDLIPQFKTKTRLDFDSIRIGIKLIGWGLFKKVVIADRLAIYVDAVFAYPSLHNTLQLLLAMWFFAIQLYCDFSAYTDIARGTARLFGYKLSINFIRPLFSKNITDFYNRWHITLFTWFNDYVFLPLAFQWRSLKRYGGVLAIVITFLLSGLWHGAGWNFIIWGLLLGLVMGAEKLSTKWRQAISNRTPNLVYNGMSVFITFNILCLITIFFRSESIGDGWNFIVSMFQNIAWTPFVKGIGKSTVVYSFVVVGLLFAIEFIQELWSNNTEKRMHFSFPVRGLGYATLIILFILIGSYNGGQFVYFRF